MQLKSVCKEALVLVEKRESPCWEVLLRTGDDEHVGVGRVGRKRGDGNGMITYTDA